MQLLSTQDVRASVVSLQRAYTAAPAKKSKRKMECMYAILANPYGCSGLIGWRYNENESVVALDRRALPLQKKLFIRSTLCKYVILYKAPCNTRHHQMTLLSGLRSQQQTKSTGCVLRTCNASNRWHTPSSTIRKRANKFQLRKRQGKPTMCKAFINAQPASRVQSQQALYE